MRIWEVVVPYIVCIKGQLELDYVWKYGVVKDPHVFPPEDNLSPTLCLIPSPLLNPFCIV